MYNWIWARCVVSQSTTLPFYKVRLQGYIINSKLGYLTSPAKVRGKSSANQTSHFKRLRWCIVISLNVLSGSCKDAQSLFHVLMVFKRLLGDVVKMQSLHLINFQGTTRICSHYVCFWCALVKRIRSQNQNDLIGDTYCSLHICEKHLKSPCVELRGYEYRQSRCHL